MSSLDRFILEDTNPVQTSKSKSKMRSAKKAPIPEPKKAAKSKPRKSVTFVNVENSPAQVVEEQTLGTQAHVKKGHEKYRSKDWTDAECETMLRTWRAVTGGVREHGEMELSDLQCAQKWCHAHQEDIAQMPEFARDIQSVDDEEVSRSLRGSSLILSPAVMLALNMYRANGYEIVNCQIFQHWINEYESPRLDVVEMRKHLPEDRTLIWPLQYSLHWILCVINRQTMRFDVYDSLRDYAHGVRKAMLMRVKTLLRRAWGRNLQFHLRACDQQDAFSNDCAIHTLRNAFDEMKVSLRGGAVVSRRWLADKWRARAEMGTQAATPAVSVRSGSQPPSFVSWSQSSRPPPRKKPRSESQSSLGTQQTQRTQVARRRMSEVESLKAMFRN